VVFEVVLNPAVVFEVVLNPPTTLELSEPKTVSPELNVSGNPVVEDVARSVDVSMKTITVDRQPTHRLSAFNSICKLPPGNNNQTTAPGPHTVSTCKLPPGNNNQTTLCLEYPQQLLCCAGSFIVQYLLVY